MKEHKVSVPSTRDSGAFDVVSMASEPIRLVDDCKNKRYMIKFLDESSGGQD
jgi:hypothetical protein